MSRRRDTPSSEVPLATGPQRYAVAYRGHASIRVTPSFAALATTRIGPATVVMCGRRGPHDVYWVLERISELGLELVEVRPISEPTD